MRLSNWRKKLNWEKLWLKNRFLTETMEKFTQKYINLIPWILAAIVFAMLAISIERSVSPLYRYAKQREVEQTQSAIGRLEKIVADMFAELAKNTYATSEGMDFAKLTSQAIEGENIRFFRMKVNEIRTFLKADFVEILSKDAEVLISQPYWEDRVSEYFPNWHVLKNTKFNEQNNTFELVEGNLYALSSKYIFLDGHHIGYLIIGKEVNASLLDQWSFSLTTELALLVGEEKRYSTLKDEENMVFISEANKKDDLVEHNGTTYSFNEYQILNSEKKNLGTIQIAMSLKKLFESLKLIPKSIIYYVTPLVIICLLLVFSISKGLISLSARLKRALFIIENQNKDLENKVAQRTKELSTKQQEISAIFKSVPTGVVVIEKNGQIGHEYSRETEKIFETENLGTLQFSNFLIDVSNLSEDEKERSRQVINTCLGEPSLTFELNKGNLPKEYMIHMSDKNKFIQINWSYIIDEERNIDKILACINDVTQFKILEQESHNQREKLKIFNSIMNLDAQQYASYSQGMFSLLEKLREIIEENINFNKENLEGALRYLHTIKGNSRTYGFTGICDITHHIESRICENKNHITQDWFRNQMVELDNRWKKITDMARRIQNFSKGMSAKCGSLVLTDIDVQDLLADLEICKQSSKPNLNGIIDNIKQLRACSFADTIEPCLQELKILCEEHEKGLPEVCIKGRKTFIKSEYINQFQDIFGHLFKNSFSHGFLESKSDSFVIYIDIEKEQEGFHIYYQDSGPGINIKKLRDKVKTLGDLPEQDLDDLQVLANLIWESGVSTKDKITEVAGRGIGMDAVKFFIEELGGGVAVNLLEPEVNNSGFIKFKLDIYFPRQIIL